MFPRTCDANPSWNRPPENLARSHAVYAVSIGLRGKATTMLVRTTRVSVCGECKCGDRERVVDGLRHVHDVEPEGLGTLGPVRGSAEW